MTVHPFSKHISKSTFLVPPYYCCSNFAPHSSLFVRPLQLSTALAPTLAVWAFGLWGTGFLGVSSDYFTYGLVAALVGVPAGVAVWLTTHKRRMPDDRWYRLSLALVAFVSCVAWIYYLADRAVTLIEVSHLGKEIGLRYKAYVVNSMPPYRRIASRPGNTLLLRC